jgi:hypothetical protein
MCPAPWKPKRLPDSRRLVRRSRCGGSREWSQGDSTPRPPGCDARGTVPTEAADRPMNTGDPSPRRLASDRAGMRVDRGRSRPIRARNGHRGEDSRWAGALPDVTKRALLITGISRRIPRRRVRRPPCAPPGRPRTSCAGSRRRRSRRAAHHRSASVRRAGGRPAAARSEGPDRPRRAAPVTGPRSPRA